MKWHKSFIEQMRECRNEGNQFVIDNPTHEKEEVIVCAYFKTYCHSKACIDKRYAEEYKRITEKPNDSL